MGEPEENVDARTDWEARSGRRRRQRASRVPGPARPGQVEVSEGRGQVTLSWSPVPGAEGYLVHRVPAGADDEPPPDPDRFRVVDHHGGDVLAVPGTVYTDTTGTPGTRYWYAVAAVADVETVGPLSEPVPATPAVAGDARVHARVHAAQVTGPLPRPWQLMIGSERLSMLRTDDTVGGRRMADDLRAALRAAHDELGVSLVRAHAILHDDLGVYREVDGAPVYDFSAVDEVYDELVDIGLRPVVEISFMPADLASDPSRTVFDYRAIVSPPKDWDRWAGLVRALVAHLVQRYGREEVVTHWAFEVWNEPNLEVFWSGTPEEFWALYDVTARAVKDVDPRLRVGGPSSAAAAWVDQLLDHVAGSGAPVDFVSTHTYGSPPLDLRPALRRHGRADTPVWWTEWGVSPTHFGPSNDGPFSAAFLVKGMHAAAAHAQAVSYWVVSDQFEELGRPPALLHGGFGLRTVGDLRKPRWWALVLLSRLGPQELGVELEGDGALGMVEAWASTDPGTGRVSVLVWNATLDQTKAGGSPLLGRDVTLTVDGLTGASYRATEWRVDADHSDISRVWSTLAAGAPWPDEAGWARLRAADRLEQGRPPWTTAPVSGRVTVGLHVPMPGLALLELDPR